MHPPPGSCAPADAGTEGLGGAQESEFQSSEHTLRRGRGTSGGCSRPKACGPEERTGSGAVCVSSGPACFPCRCEGSLSKSLAKPSADTVAIRDPGVALLSMGAGPTGGSGGLIVQAARWETPPGFGEGRHPPTKRAWSSCPGGPGWNPKELTVGDGGQSWGRYPGRNFLSHKINRRIATKQGCSEDNTALRESGKRVLPFPWTGYFGCPKFAPGFGQVSRRGGGEAPQPSLALALSVVSLRRKGEASSKVRLRELALGTGMPPPRTERGLRIQLETGAGAEAPD